MNVNEALLTRRTVHRYSADPVPDEVIEQALEAAHHAPCHKLTWPWRFVLPGPVAREKLLQVAFRKGREKFGGGALPPHVEEGLRAKVERPARLIVVLQKVDADAFRAKEDYAACAAAVQNLMLSVTASGYASKWGTGGLTRDPESHEVLGVAGDEEVVGFVWVGVPEKVPNIKRPPVSQHVQRLP